MAAINLSGATSTLASASFIKAAVLVVVGSLLAQIVTSYMKRNVRDFQVRGGDAIYAIVASLLALIILPGNYGRPVALGSTATAVRTAASDFGVV